MKESKHKIVIGCEVLLLCMMIGVLGTKAASSNPPSNGVSYGKNNQTTVEGALNDLYTKSNQGNATAAQILKDKTALVGGKKITGTMPLKKGSSQATKVSANASNVYMVFPYGYYPAENHFSTANSSEVYASNANVASAIGLTAGKLLKGQTVLGITGTGETGIDTSDATATASDISNGKTAYVNGQKITGTGMKGKTYEFKNKVVTVSDKTFSYGTWKSMGSPNSTIYYTIDLGFSPTTLYSCHVNLTGNYATDKGDRWDANFRMTRGGTDYWYTKNIANDFYLSTTNSMNTYTDTVTDCEVDGSKLSFTVKTFNEGSGSGNCPISTRASTFYLSGVIAYD